MKRAVMALVLVGGLVASLALARGNTANLSVLVRNALTLIDTVPTKAQLNEAFDGEVQALASLSTIAKDTTADVGVRVRAIYALAKYCPDPCTNTEVAYLSLTSLINATKNETLGESVVVLRTAIETIGVLAVPADVSADVRALLVSILDHASRDIRAATARALRDLCNSQAVIPLRVRYAVEPTEQVKLAISEALRILGQCGT